MKTLSTILLCFITLGQVFSGPISSREVTIFKVPASTEYKVWQIPVGYAQIELRLPEKFDQLKAETIVSITLVHSKFRQSENFSQSTLNEKRWKELKKKLGSAMDNPMIELETISQSQADELAAAQSLFHGFIIRTIPRATKASMAIEIDNIDRILEGKPVISPFAVKSNPAPISLPKEAINEVLVEESETLEPALVSDVAVALDSRPFNKRKRDGEATYYGESYTWEGDTLTDSTGYMGGDIVSPYYWGNLYGNDSTVLAVMARHKEWKDMLILTDVTGSMYPYSGQILLWHKLNSKMDRTKSFVFFNDGNMKPDYAKIAGKTGGVYIAPNTSLLSVKTTAQKAMRNGGGGDAPENNIEATIKGLNKCTDCGDIIMIADNWATPRDTRFIKDIDRPIHFILCGTYGGINPAYLNLAKKNGGTVHTMEKDVTALTELNEGERVRLGGSIYEIRNGNFQLVRRGVRNTFARY